MLQLMTESVGRTSDDRVAIRRGPSAGARSGPWGESATIQALSDLEAEWNEHWCAARGYASTLVGERDGEDVAALAALRVLNRTRSKAAPIENMRAYLLTAVRRVAADHLARQRELPVPDVAHLDAASAEGTSTEGEAAIAEALDSLPPAWRQVLLLTEVHQMRHREIAHLIGATPNGVAALKYRAMEALRKAYLTALLGEAESEACADAHRDLPAFARGTLTPVRGRRLAAHLESCTACQDTHADLATVAARMPALAGIRRRTSA